MTFLTSRYALTELFSRESTRPNSPTYDNVPRAAPDPGAVRICLLAMKRLEYNTRIKRQAQSLREAGFSVTVASITPKEAMEEPAGPGVRHVSVPVGLPVVNFIGAVLQFGEFEDPPLRSHPISPAEPPHRVGPLRRSPVLHALLFPVRVVSAAAIYALIRLQSPAGHRLNVDWHEVTAARTAKLLRAVIRPYVAELRRWKYGRQAWALLRGEQFDVVQAHDNHTLQAATRLARACGARLIYDAVEIFEHLSDHSSQGGIQLFYKRMLARDVALLKSADLITTVSSGVAGWMSETYGVPRPAVIRNCQMPRPVGGDTRLREEIGAGPSDRIVLYVNSLYAGQGVETLIRALAHLPAEIRVATIGREKPAGYMEECRGLARSLGMEDRVSFLPVRANADLIPFISGADVGVIPRSPTPLNNLYSLPNRLFEMVMAELPIVSTNLPCIREIVEEMGVGLVFEPGDERGLAGAIDEILNKDRYPGYKRRVRAAAGILSWPREAERYVGLVSDLVACGR